MDVLEDAAWTRATPGHTAAVEARLGPLVKLAVVPPRARKGAAGLAVRTLKKVGARAFLEGSKRAFAGLAAANRTLVEALN